MQDRYPIHYDGNTVNIPNPGRKNLAKRQAMPELGDTPRVYTHEFKICATHSCVWCKNDFDEYRIRCNVCGTCQYCGTISTGSIDCTTCGNHLPDELNKPFEVRRIIVA